MKRIDALVIILIISICCAGIAFAEENNSSVEQSIEETEISEDGAIYTLIASISGDEIKFNDGFTGYCIDSSKGAVSSDDKFTPGSFKNDKTENYVKLAIIECYKQERENDIGKVVSKIVNNDLDSSDSVIKEVLNSNENVNSGTTVKIDNTTEATFNFELLKPADSEKSDCLAYTVSMKTVENKNPSTVQKDDTLGVSNSSDNDKKVKEDNVEKTTGNASDEKTKEDTSKTEDTSKANKTDDKAKNDTIVNETNKTIVNKTNTKITVENNTTIIYKNNVKTVNQTAPANNTTNDLLKTAGNPIFILGVVIVVALIAVAFMRRKD